MDQVIPQMQVDVLVPGFADTGGGGGNLKISGDGSVGGSRGSGSR